MNDVTISAAASAPSGAAAAVDLLVVGYGNTLRQDDGVGPLTAERIEALGLPRVAVLTCHQLSPEHVERVSWAHAVVFIDAGLGGEAVRLRPVVPARFAQAMAHALEPPTILALARDVYGRLPNAWLLTIPVAQLGFGENLSPAAARGVEQAVSVVLRKFAFDWPSKTTAV